MTHYDDQQDRVQESGDADDPGRDLIALQSHESTGEHRGGQADAERPPDQKDRSTDAEQEISLQMWEEARNERRQNSEPQQANAGRGRKADHRRTDDAISVLGLAALGGMSDKTGDGSLDTEIEIAYVGAQLQHE